MFILSIASSLMGITSGGRLNLIFLVDCSGILALHIGVEVVVSTLVVLLLLEVDACTWVFVLVHIVLTRGPELAVVVNAGFKSNLS